MSSKSFFTKSNDSSDSGSRTNDEIKNLCLKCENDDSCNSCNKSSGVIYKLPGKRYDPGTITFTSVVTPLNDIQPQYSGCKGSVEFHMRRKNKTVTLQWEPFKAKLTTNGVSHVTVSQSITNLPNHPVRFPIFIQHKEVGKNTHVLIDPHVTSGNIKFFLNTDGTATGTSVHDSIYIHGGAVTWIVE